jgi:hypothetical protein
MAIISETQSSPSSNVSNTTGDVTKLLHSGKLYTILSSFNLLNFIVGYMFISTFLIVANLKGRNPMATLLLLNTVVHTHQVDISRNLDLSVKLRHHRVHWSSLSQGVSISDLQRDCSYVHEVAA